MKKSGPTTSKNIQRDKPFKQLNMHIGWLHKSKGNKYYSQVKKPAGGIRNLKLSSADFITVASLVELSRPLFFENNNCKFGSISTMDIAIGNFDGSVIEEFMSKEGKPCGLWKYLEIRGLAPSRHNLYMLTQEKESSDDASLDMDSQNENKPPHPVRINKEDNLLTDIPEFSIAYYREVSSVFCENKSYLKLHGRASCFDFASSNHEIPDLLQEEQFHPLEYGFFIASISIGDCCYFELQPQSKKIIFPMTSAENQPHTILHDSMEMVGIYEGKLGTAVIPSCSEHCHPKFVWYKDGEVKISGECCYWININEPGLYSCEIYCDNLSTFLRSQSIQVDTSSDCNEKANVQVQPLLT